MCQSSLFGSKTKTLTMMETYLIVSFQPMPMNYGHMHKVPVAKRVSFNDISEDVLETFLKIRTTYITDGQVLFYFAFFHF